jgi:curli biogenesis system outer membrane secretion channel CsgG
VSKIKFTRMFALTLVLSLGISEISGAQVSKTQISNFILSKTDSSFSKPSTQRKIRIAVLDFDFSSVSSPWWSSGFRNLGKGVSDILISKLGKDNKYSLIERTRIDAILAEQNLSASQLVDPITAAKIGKLLGVEAVVIGSITQFDLQNKKSAGGGLFGGLLGGLGVSNQSTDAEVKLNVRVVNTTTGEILFTAEGKGKDNQSDVQVLTGLGAGGSSTDNSSKLLTLATEKAVDKVVRQFNSKSNDLASLPVALPSVSATVADISGNTVILNKGTSDGYATGLKLSIERVSRTVKDPYTGKVIRNITEPVGVIQLTEVDGTSSVGKIISGAAFKIGDVAKPTE